MSELHDAIRECVERLERYRNLSKRIGEQNTKASLIEPIIAALGWDVHEPDELNREYRRHGRDNPVDYALLLLRTARLFIEAKGLGENLDDPRWARQTISYATDAGVVWVALTDGAEWRIYNAHAPVPIEQKLFRAVRLEEDIDGAAELLSLLSKENMRDNRIEEMWKAYFVDRQVYAELVDLFSGAEPPSDLVTLLDKRLSSLGREEIRSSLMRARATFDFPRAANPPVVQPTPRVPAQSPSTVRERPLEPPQTAGVEESAAAAGRRRTPAKPRVSSEERQIRVPDMIAAGRLRPGAVLHGHYMGQQYSAELLADGTVRFRREVLRSLSAAGKAVKVVVHGAGVPDSVTSTDGLDFWRAEDLRGRAIRWLHGRRVGRVSQR